MIKPLLLIGMVLWMQPDSVIIDFSTEGSVSNWRIVDDVVMGGRYRAIIISGYVSRVMVKNTSSGSGQTAPYSTLMPTQYRPMERGKPSWCPRRKCILPGGEGSSTFPISRVRHSARSYSWSETRRMKNSGSRLIQWRL